MFAQQSMSSEAFSSWNPVTADELLAYFGFMMLMGIVKLPSNDDYWRKDEALNYRMISQRIPRDRFKDLSRYLHFADNTSLVAPGCDGYDRIGKVRLVLDPLAERFLSLYNPNCECSVDEAMVAFKGRSSMKQYLPLKPVRRGFKIWVRADSMNGYVSEFQVYLGKQDSSEDGLGARVVKDLTRKIQHKQHHVYFDNYFNSLPLLTDLLNVGVYGCGTIRSNRKWLSEDLKEMRKKLKKRGDMAIRQCSNLTVTLWMDTKVVMMAATNSNPLDVVNVRRKLRTGQLIEVPSPGSIVAYNKHMGGVDRNDQVRKYYHVRTKCRKSY